MTVLPSSKTHKAANLPPQRLILIVICALCLGLLGSALFTFVTLSRLRTYYLSNRGHEIASAIEAQVRGPGRRNNPAFWQSILETNYEAYSGSAAFLALIDQNGIFLQALGNYRSGLENPPELQRGMFIYSKKCYRSRAIHATKGGMRQPAGAYA